MNVETFGEMTDIFQPDEMIDDTSRIAEGYFTPEVRQELASIGEEIAMLGYADDPELMGALIKKIIGAIKKRIAERKKKGAQASLSLPGGGQLSYNLPGSQLPATTTGSGFQVPEALKNPMVLAGIGGGALLLIMLMKKKKR